MIVQFGTPSVVAMRSARGSVGQWRHTTLPLWLGEADAVAQRTAMSYGSAEVVQPETQALVDQITATRRGVSSNVDS